MPARLYAMDTAKGIGIAFVVFGHAWRGAYDAGLLTDSDLFRWVDAVIYAWHMPLFFFLSGIFFLELLKRRAPFAFLKDRGLRLLWPMAIWTWIFFGAKLLAGTAANHPVGLADFPLIPLPPYEHLWFLWTLFLVQGAVLALYLALRGRLDQKRLRLLAGIGAMGLALFMPLIYLPSTVFGPAVAHFPFFLAGIAMGGHGNARPSGLMAAAAAVIFAVLLAQVALSGGASISSLALTVLLYSVCLWLDPNRRVPGPTLRLLRTLGRYSMAIFLAHTIFSAAVRIGLIQVDYTALVPQLLLASLAGLLGPILLVLLARRLRLQRLLGL